jgi:two-component system, OmpR family, phosphate regulon response regulator PhoB
MRKILLADDQEELRLLLQAILEDGDYELLQAQSGPEALALTRQEKPALVVMDWMMPGMSGVDVAKALKMDPETGEIPIILLTARNRAEDRRAGFAAGVSEYISKPFSPLELIETVERLLGASVTPPTPFPRSV